MTISTLELNEDIKWMLCCWDQSSFIYNLNLNYS